MFGFSLTKLLVLALIVGGVLMLFKVLSRKSEAAGSSDGPSGDASRRPHEDDTKAYETEYDAESDTYVVRNGKKLED
jgi:hypothetical protein